MTVPAQPSGVPRGGPDVVVLGEVLVELSSREPLADGAAMRLSFSGDALNAAAAGAAAGAHTLLVARMPDDELGDVLAQRVAELGIDTSGLIRRPGQHGLYLTHADPEGRRQFVYARNGSAGSELSPEDLDDDLLRGAGVVVASGVTCAISPSAAAAVHHAARTARRFVYDPNFRARLTTSAAAAGHLRSLAAFAEVVTPSWPDEAAALLALPGGATPRQAGQAVLELGARGVVLTRGADGAMVLTEGRAQDVAGVTAPSVVDQTGAGDCLAGTLAARLALGDHLVDAVRLGVAAAALSVQGQGGTGHVPTLEESRHALAVSRPARSNTAPEPQTSEAVRASRRPKELTQP